MKRLRYKCGVVELDVFVAKMSWLEKDELGKLVAAADLKSTDHPKYEIVLTQDDDTELVYRFSDDVPKGTRRLLDYLNEESKLIR